MGQSQPKLPSSSPSPVPQSLSRAPIGRQGIVRQMRRQQGSNQPIPPTACLDMSLAMPSWQAVLAQALLKMMLHKCLKWARGMGLAMCHGQKPFLPSRCGRWPHQQPPATAQARKKPLKELLGAAPRPMHPHPVVRDPAGVRLALANPAAAEAQVHNRM